VNRIAWKGHLAGLAVVFFGAWEAFHWLHNTSGRDPWTFGLGFASAALVFGFWGSSAPSGDILVKGRPEAAPALHGIDTTLAELISEAQDVSEREKKAANRLSLYNEA
jgi:hypothetical protein